MGMATATIDVRSPGLAETPGSECGGASRRAGRESRLTGACRLDFPSGRRAAAGLRPAVAATAISYLRWTELAQHRQSAYRPFSDRTRDMIGSSADERELLD